MKSLFFAAALSYGLTLAHPRYVFPHSDGYNTTSVATLPVGTGTACCTSAAANVTTVDAEGTSRNGTTPYGCTTYLTTTIIYVFAPDDASFILFPTTPSASSTTTSDENSYYYSVVNGTTVWQDGRTPPPNAATKWYLTSTTWVFPTEETAVDTTLTATTQRTLTSIVPSASTFRTETIIVTETIATITHVTRPAPSTIELIPFTIVDGAAGFTTITTASTITVPAVSSAPGDVSSAVETTHSEDTNEAPSSLSTLGSGGTASSSSSSEAEETVVITSSRMTTVSGTHPSTSVSSMSEVEETIAITSSRTVTVNGSHSTPLVISLWNSTTGSSTSKTPQTSIAQTSSGTSEDVSISNFPSLLPTGTEGVIYPGTATGTAAQPSGIDASNFITPPSASLPRATLSSSSVYAGSPESTQTVTISTTVTGNVTSAPISTSITSESAATGFEQTSLIQLPFSNSTLANPALTSPVPSNATSAVSAGTTAVPVSSGSQTSAIPCTTSGPHTHASLNNVTSVTSSSWATSASILDIVSTSSSAALRSTETNPVATGAGNDTTSSPVPSTFPATSRTPPGLLTLWSNIQSSTVNSTQADGVATQVSSSYSAPISSVPSSVTPAFPTSAAVSSHGYGGTPPYPTSMPNNSTNANATAGCGETGQFTINWDDQPLYVQDTEDDPPYAPVFNPYHHLFFANGLSYYAPDYSITHPGTYDPVSGPNVAIFRVDATTSIDDRDKKVGNMLPGAIGAGPRVDDRIYWFNAYSAELGCENGGSVPCNMTISGYTWNKSTLLEDRAVVQYAQIVPCNQLEDCVLEHVALNDFHGLSSIRFEAAVDGATLKSWVVDNLSMEWYDNSCEAGLKRISVKR